MNRKILFDYLYVCLIISLIAFMIFVVFYMKNNSAQCLADPITFFEERNEGAECNCFKDGVPYKKVEIVENYTFVP